MSIQSWENLIRKIYGDFLLDNNLLGKLEAGKSLYKRTGVTSLSTCRLKS